MATISLSLIMGIWLLATAFWAWADMILFGYNPPMPMDLAAANYTEHRVCLICTLIMKANATLI